MLTDAAFEGDAEQFDDTPYLNPQDPPSKRQILKAALRLFARQRVETVTVRQIAEEAGYTNPALFKYFPTKDALALYLFETCYVTLYDRLKKAIDDKSCFNEQLNALLGVYFSQLERNLDAFLYVQDHLRQMWPHVALSTRKKSILSLIKKVLEQGIREGAVARLNPGLLVTALTGTVQQFARMLCFGEFQEKPSQWRPELEAILRRIMSA